MANKDAIFLDDLKPHLEGITVFSPLYAKINNFQKDMREGSIYVDNYKRSDVIHKLIKISLLEIETDDVKMELSNSSIQIVPWSAFRGVFGTFIHTQQTGVLLLEFKKNLFA